jgi:hypothetical protein
MHRYKYRESRYKERRRLSKAERAELRKERKEFRYNAGPGGYAAKVLKSRTGSHFKRGF